MIYRMVRNSWWVVRYWIYNCEIAYNRIEVNCHVQVVKCWSFDDYENDKRPAKTITRTTPCSAVDPTQGLAHAKQALQH
jgi:hypothetical protein